MVTALTLIVEGAVRVTVAVQPIPDTVAVAPAVKRKPAGRVSTNARPIWGGLPATLVRRKLSGVLVPAVMAALEKRLLSVGRIGTMAVNMLGTVSVSAVLTVDVAPTNTWKPFPPLVPAVASKGIVALMTIGNPHRSGTVVLTT